MSATGELRLIEIEMENLTACLNVLIAEPRTSMERASAMMEVIARGLKLARRAHVLSPGDAVITQVITHYEHAYQMVVEHINYLLTEMVAARAETKH